MLRSRNASALADSAVFRGVATAAVFLLMNLTALENVQGPWILRGRGHNSGTTKPIERPS